MVHHTKKTQKARIQGHSKKPNRTGTWVTILIILIIIAAVGITSKWTFFLPQGERDVAVATVNGEPITSKEFEMQWEALPVQAKMQVDRTELLDQLISEKLLLQKADSEGIIISDEEIDQFINTQLAQSGMTFEQYEQLLTAQGTTLDEMKSLYRKQLAVAKLFDETVTENIDPTLEDIQEYYDSNKEEFYREEQVTVRHILIQVNQNFNDTQAQERVSMIEESLDAKNNTNFCDMVTNYSMDFGSRGLCGEYTFPRGVMVPEFENASFEMKSGERRVVKSSFGYHIILKMDNVAAGYLGLDEVMIEYPNQPTVKNIINQTLAQENAKRIFDNYVERLFEEATIEYHDIDLTPAEKMSLEE